MITENEAEEMLIQAGIPEKQHKHILVVWEESGLGMTAILSAIKSMGVVIVRNMTEPLKALGEQTKELELMFHNHNVIELQDDHSYYLPYEETSAIFIPKRTKKKRRSRHIK